MINASTVWMETMEPLLRLYQLREESALKEASVQSALSSLDHASLVDTRVSSLELKLMCQLGKSLSVMIAPRASTVMDLLTLLVLISLTFKPGLIYQRLSQLVTAQLDSTALARPLTLSKASVIKVSIQRPSLKAAIKQTKASSFLWRNLPNRLHALLVTTVLGARLRQPSLT